MKKIPFYLDRRQILIPRGLRRTGKTTLLYQIIHYLLKEKKVSPNLLTSEKKRKKYYLAYPAFALALTGEWSKEFKGKLVENLFVFLFKARFFYQSSTKEKVDMVLPKESTFYLSRLNIVDEFKERIWLASKSLSIAITQKGVILYLMILKQNKLNNLLTSEQMAISFNINLSSFASRSKLDNVLTVILIGAIITAIGTLIYVISTPKVQFLLYRDNQSEPYRNLHLWIDVVEKKILEL